MKTTAIFSAALLGASMFSYGALAQTSPDVPGSETQVEMQNAQERDNVADDAGMGNAAVSQPSSETIVPGSDSQRANNRADQRDAVAADDTMSTGAMNADGATDGGPIVPGSGATFGDTNAPKSQADQALQDEAPTNSVQ
ncbi:hypothetical protein [Jiella mangrovi]|uniref:Uncharacterized protein n=1 Tax=Jiella mangrovi TaxID=2821407 RepID=A0ABS4BHS4_9HYPH|nr:hypothetical protein [Jiella mangrovi]MBP0616307.1 hypothetical protein [Jiella mangrovi]